MSTYTIALPRKKANNMTAARFVESLRALGHRFMFLNLKSTSKMIAILRRGEEKAELGKGGTRRVENGRREEQKFLV